jgi:CRP/FNR family transcriptional regulator
MAYHEHSAAVAAPLRLQPTVGVERDWAAAARATRVKTHRLPAHDVIYYEGDAADRIFELIEGAVMLYKLLPDGRRQVVEIIGPNDVFGMLASKTYDCNAETLTPVVVRAIDRREAEASVEMQRHLTLCLLGQLETMHEHAVLLGRKSAAERVASFLMRFVPERGGPDCPGPRQGTKDERLIMLSMTRQEIADYLGLTIETVSRVISDLKRRGLIAIEKQDRILINNVCGICQLTGAQ